MKELKGFEKVWLEPGQTKTVEFVIDREVLSFYDEAAGVWVAEEGEFEALVCAASDDVRARVSFCFE